ncbi:MAG TPA: NUDIX domain-containing protein [Verrucomicrobiae bacterium]|jgi:8-oxo-dGTP diphosphatase|nr:NUDIX domain-containing protein [Verrucomicrobiae bacterium]
MEYTNEYIAPVLTVDSVILQLIDNQLCVLVIRRTQEPFEGQWALPGGYDASGETTHDAMQRVLLTKAGIQTSSLKLVEQLYTFDTVARDPRGHAVSVTYMGLSKDIVAEHSKTTQNPQFFPVSDLPKLAYDHKDIVKYAHERLQSKVSYTNAIFALLDPLFTMSELQSAYEAVLCRPLDKRNFRKKFLSLDLIHETSEMKREGAHRPARLYAFNKQSLESLARSFD